MPLPTHQSTLLKQLKRLATGKPWLFAGKPASPGADLRLPEGGAVKLKNWGYVAIAVLLVMVSCSKKSAPGPGKGTNTTDTTKGVKADTDIYVSGTLSYPNNTVAAYWKNGVLATLAPTNQYSSTTAITTQGQDVYIAGTLIVNGIQTAVYWKNGTMVQLGYGGAWAIFVTGADVYVAGYLATGNAGTFPYKAAYWKNGVAVQLTNPVEDLSGGTPDSFATGIVVNGTDVYLTGWGNVTYGGGDPVGIYWKNGAATALSLYAESFGNLNATSQGYAIALDGTDVYIAGNITPATGIMFTAGQLTGAVYWKNGVATGITGESTEQYAFANGIAAQNGKVYVSGNLEGFTNAFYWKNGLRVTPAAAEPFSQCTGLKLFNGDIYVPGYIFNNQSYSDESKPVFWKNGMAVNLPSTIQGKATGIAFVTAQ